MNTLHPSLPSLLTLDFMAITVITALPFTLSYSLWKILTSVEPKSAFSMLSPKQLSVAEKDMLTTTRIGFTLNLWPHTSTEPSALLGTPSAFHSQFTLFSPTPLVSETLNTYSLLHIQLLTLSYTSLRK